MSSFSKPAEKAESIELTRGVLPLNTISANIDFAQTYSTNPYGTCGIKVWVYKGELLGHDPMAQDRKTQEKQTARWSLIWVRKFY